MVWNGKPKPSRRVLPFPQVGVRPRRPSSIPFDGERYQAEMMRTVARGYRRDVEGQITASFRFFQVAMRGDPRFSGAMHHSLFQPARPTPDPTSRVDVWQYQLTDPATGKRVTSSSPLSTQPRYRYCHHEARILSLSLYGNVPKYIQGLRDYLDSLDALRTLNGQPVDQPFGLDTFRVRVYIPRRRPGHAPVTPETAPDLVDELLERGVEVAFVDTGRATVGRDAPFHRFMVAGERTPDGVPLRYLVRDVDHKATAAETFCVGEWIRSGQQFHRIHLYPLCVGPLTASIFGGFHHVGDEVPHIRERIEYFPYRDAYGDDEIFTKYVLWRHMKASGDVLTHKQQRGLTSRMLNPYPRSNEEPTRAFCDELLDGLGADGRHITNRCHDVLLPLGVKFPGMELAYDRPLHELHDFLQFNLDDSRVRLAVEAFTAAASQGIPDDLFAQYTRFQPSAHRAERFSEEFFDWLKVQWRAYAGSAADSKT